LYAFDLLHLDGKDLRHTQRRNHWLAPALSTCWIGIPSFLTRATYPMSAYS
jgi:hypothetical protein